MYSNSITIQLNQTFLGLTNHADLENRVSKQINSFLKPYEHRKQSKMATLRFKLKGNPMTQEFYIKHILPLHLDQIEQLE